MAGKPRLDSIAINFDANWKLDEATGCHEWLRSKKRDGYGYLYAINKGKVIGAHVFSYERSIGPIPTGMHVCHSCDNKGCVSPAHLFLGTNTDNRLDSVVKRRHAFGSRHGQAKIDEAQAEAIKRSWKEGGVSQKQIAQQFGISQTQVSRIVNNQRWAA